MKLVELTVSHYMLARALEMNGMTERDVKRGQHERRRHRRGLRLRRDGAAVTWNPPLQQVAQRQGRTLVFDSSKIPGEIIDLMVGEHQVRRHRI